VATVVLYVANLGVLPSPSPPPCTCPVPATQSLGEIGGVTADCGGVGGLVKNHKCHNGAGLAGSSWPLATFAELNKAWQGINT